MRQQIARHEIPQRASRIDAAHHDQDIPEDDSFYPQRMPSSTRRYITTEGNEVIQQGNRRIVIHEAPPPKKRRGTLLLFVGLAFLAMVIGWIVFTILFNIWQAKQMDWTYGNPRTFQTDQFVGHSDSEAHPTHFIAVNVDGTIEVAELNIVTPKADHIYVITTVSTNTIPVSLTFADLNHDGKVDMIVTIGVGNSYAVVLLNDGIEFKPQQ